MPKDSERRMKYYESVREHTLGLILKAEEAVQNMEALGDEFVDVFEKTRKRHNSLLDKIAKRIARESKKLKIARVPRKVKRPVNTGVDSPKIVDKPK